MAYRGGLALATALGVAPVVFPGDHGGFATHEWSPNNDPAAFAAVLDVQLEAAGRAQPEDGRRVEGQHQGLLDVAGLREELAHERLHGHRSLLDATDADWEHTFADVLLGTVRACRAAVAVLVDGGGGAIVTTAAYSIRSLLFCHCRRHCPCSPWSKCSRYSQSLPNNHRAVP